MHRVTSVISALLCGAAGVYLLSKHSAPVELGGQAGQSWFEIIAHGMGIYFIGKGVFVGGSLLAQDDIARHTRQLVELAAREPDDTAEA